MVKDSYGNVLFTDIQEKGSCEESHMSGRDRALKEENDKECKLC